MTISALDAKAALVVIDLQKGIVGMPTAHPMQGVIRNSVALAEAFRRDRRPVVLVNVDGAPPGRAERSFSLSQMPAGWTELIPELNCQPTDHLVTKQTRGAFTNTGLEAASPAGRRHPGGRLSASPPVPASSPPRARRTNWASTWCW